MSVFIRIVMLMMVVAVAVVVMLVIVVVAVVFAAFRRCGQLAVQIGGHQLFHCYVRGAGAHGDAVVIEIGKGALADTAGDDDTRALLAQPAREKSRRVRRRYHWLDADNFLLIRVSLHKRELSAAAKMSVKPSFDCGNCDGYHVCFYFFVGLSGAIATRIS